MRWIQTEKIEENYFCLRLIENEEQVASLFFVLHGKKVFIENMSAKYSGKRLGSFLLFYLCNLLSQQFSDVKWVFLDDCTGILPPKNIYYKLGFQVKDETYKNFFCSWNNWLLKYQTEKENPSEERRISLQILQCNLKKFLQDI